MKGMLTVLARELAEWRLLFLVAFIAGLIPLAVPWLPSPGGLEPAEIRDGMALGLALVASAVLAVVLGSSVLARDLSERRLGFYFVRPLPGASIWAGKMLGAAVLAIGTGALILLPTLLAGGHVAPTASTGSLATAHKVVAVLQLLLGVLLLLVMAHAVSVMVRSRSPWLALDLVALAVVAATLWSCRRLLRSETAFGAAEVMLFAFALAVLIAAAIAGLVQVVRGRTDLRRGHRLLSLVLWSMLGLAALGGTAYTRWVLGAAPRDLLYFQAILPAPSGSWIAIGGPAAGRFGYEPAFLFDLASGRFVKIHGDLEPFRLRSPAFSRDGSRAAWLSWSEEGAVLSSLDLRRSGAVPVRSNVSYKERPQAFVLSPDGSRVAALWQDRVMVDDLRTGRMLVSQSLPEDLDFDNRLRFVTSGHLRIFRAAETREAGGPPVWRLTVLDLDIATRRITPGASIDATGRNWGFNLSPDGDRALLQRSPAQELRLADPRTGRTRTLAVSGGPYGATFLSDGRLLLNRIEGRRIILRLLSSEGAEQLGVSLPGVRLAIGGQPAPGLLAVATAQGGGVSSKEYEAWTSWLVDLRTGRVRRIDRGLLPATVGLREPGSLPSRMFYRGRGDLLLFDPATGKLRTVLPGTHRTSGPAPGSPRYVQMIDK